ncbi:PP2C family serine/threonine-protein phosphatase [Roseomonas sp. AR75]|jgi:protein phosphatase/serine/threonine-protein phosphatase Stp1|uniref:PP2C family protein-serine/threonine phosphatase n=1 Tax=Roseomonas sp. AR75 TaxID=2562311 RepID=UPI0010C0130E|nr:protein phosphatase 2C domain-containing protein [Roseomonas sp. AR75]
MSSLLAGRFRSSGRTDPGARRSHNEDSYLDRPEAGLWAVADGAGGHEAGEVASGMIRDALAAIPDDLPAGQVLGEVRQRLALVHEALREAGARQGGGTIASTVVVLIVRGGHFACLWAGDSRLYRLRQGSLEQITRDHSLVQELVDAGMLHPDEAESHPRANVITRAVGAGEDGLEVDKTSDRVLPGDRFLLCSDGLTKTLPAGEIATLLAVPDAALAPELLIAAALAREASDNVTAVAVEAGAETARG